MGVQVNGSDELGETLSADPLLDAEVVDEAEHQPHQPLIPHLGFPKTRFWVLIAPGDCLTMPIDTAWAQARRFCDGLERLANIRFDAIGDFLAAFSYSEWHRTHCLN